MTYMERVSRYSSEKTKTKAADKTISSVWNDEEWDAPQMNMWGKQKHFISIVSFNYTAHTSSTKLWWHLSEELAPPAVYLDESGPNNHISEVDQIMQNFCTFIGDSH